MRFGRDEAWLPAGRFGDHEPGGQPLEAHVLFEEWADERDQHVAEVLVEHVTAEGRRLRPGDRITPAQAIRERVRWRRVSG